jgi:hypothetical protein
MTTITPPVEADLKRSPWMKHALAEQSAQVAEAHDKSFFPVKGRPTGERPWTDKKGNLYLLNQGVLYDNEKPELKGSVKKFYNCIE